MAFWKTAFLPDLSISSVQLLSSVWHFETPWTAVCQASHHQLLSITNSRNLLKLMSIESMMPPNHLILCHPLFLLPSIFPSIRVFSSESVLHIRWPKYWSFSFSISPSNVYSGLISFRIDWFDLLAIQVTFKSLLQHHSSKASIVLCLKSLSTQRRLLPWPPIPAPWSIKYLNSRESKLFLKSHQLGKYEISWRVIQQKIIFNRK